VTKDGREIEIERQRLRGRKERLIIILLLHKKITVLVSYSFA
jgi:hypothetical protein